MIRNQSIILIVSILPSLSFAQIETLNFQKQQITNQLSQQLCQQLPKECGNKNDWKFYKVKQKINQTYLISNLKLFQIEQNKQMFTVLNQWDFSNYQPKIQRPRWASYAEGDEINHVSIFPKLFKITDKAYAVGIVQEWHEGYSGGGMSEEVADFLQLKANRQYQQVFQNVPLSMYRMIRACFSEEDYKKAGEHCHDEYTLNTQIEYSKPYEWKVKYEYQSFISKVSDSEIKSIHQRKTYTLNSNKANAIQFPKAW